MIDGHIHFHKQPYTLETIDLMVEEALKNDVTTLYLLDHTHKFYEFLFLYDNLSGDETLGWFKKKIHVPISEYLEFIKLVKSKEYPVEIKFVDKVKDWRKKDKGVMKKVYRDDGRIFNHWVGNWSYKYFFSEHDENFIKMISIRLTLLDAPRNYLQRSPHN